MNFLALKAEIIFQVTGLDPTVLFSHFLLHQRNVVRIRRRVNRAPNRKRNRGYGLKEMDLLSDNDFKRMFRLSRNAFNFLFEILQDAYIESDEIKAKASSGSTISLRTKLAVSLRWLAGGSYLDLCFAFGIAKGSFFHADGVLWGTLTLIDEALKIEFPFHDVSKLEQIAEGFNRFSHQRLSNCVMAIDGWVCRTRQPRRDEVLCPMGYRNRKGCYGIVVLAGCDANTKFLMFSCQSTGSTNDYLAWKWCTVKELLDEGHLPNQFYFIGDEAFINCNQFLVPWSGHSLDPWKSSFNYHLSAMRQCIERAFALLVKRWGIFWRPLYCSLNRWSLVCTVAAKLHNFCIDMNEGGETQILERLAADTLDGDFPWVFLNDEERDEADRPTGDRRRIITERLCSEGIRRPGY
jgi:hypothetical protein